MHATQTSGPSPAALGGTTRENNRAPPPARAALERSLGGGIYTMDISAFNSDDFEVQSWINEVLREKSADTSLDSHISAVSMKLQILSAVS